MRATSGHSYSRFPHTSRHRLQGCLVALCALMACSCQAPYSADSAKLPLWGRSAVSDKPAQRRILTRDDVLPQGSTAQLANSAHSPARPHSASQQPVAVSNPATPLGRSASPGRPVSYEAPLPRTYLDALPAGQLELNRVELGLSGSSSTAPKVPYMASAQLPPAMARQIVPETYPACPCQTGHCPPPGYGSLEGGPLPQPIGGGWPSDEYLCDGGDTQLGVRVSPNWDVMGLDPTDTVAHFDTLDGRTLVKASNRVCIYAPRFGAVRSITRLAAGEQVDMAGRFGAPLGPGRIDDLGVPLSSVQHDPALAQTGPRMLGALRTKTGDGQLSANLWPRAVDAGLLPYEDLQVIRTGLHDQAEKARLAQSIDAAIAWAHDHAVVALIDNQRAVATVGEQRGQVTYTVDDRRNSPCLRVIKVADTQSAQVGELVHFTIRFDNVGDQPIGNIVLLDQLTTRLEYVADSSQSSVKVHFTAEPNDSDSTTLRWQLIDPLEVGAGGLVRFSCRVR